MGALGARYRVVRALGDGAASEVVEAIALGAGTFERRVIIKRPLAGADPELTAGFLDEARTASLLHHANLVPVLDHGVDDDGRPFLVMEYVDGLDLGAVVSRARAAGQAVPAPIALHVAREIAHGLAYAHGVVDREGRPLGVVHRDVAPKNVLVSWEGDVRLTDFGIAMAHGRGVRTQVGVTKGTLDFMSPEQLGGGHVDGRADLYALGALLHYLLTGRSVHGGTDRGARAAGQRDIERALPPAIRALIERATAPRRADRHPDARAMASELWSAWLTLGEHSEPRSALVTWLERLRSGAPAPARATAESLIELGVPVIPPPRAGTMVPAQAWPEQSETELRAELPALPEIMRPQPIASAPELPLVVPRSLVMPTDTTPERPRPAPVESTWTSGLDTLDNDEDDPTPMPADPTAPMPRPLLTPLPSLPPTAPPREWTATPPPVMAQLTPRDWGLVAPVSVAPPPPVRVAWRGVAMALAGAALALTVLVVAVAVGRAGGGSHEAEAVPTPAPMASPSAPGARPLASAGSLPSVAGSMPPGPMPSDAPPPDVTPSASRPPDPDPSPPLGAARPRADGARAGARAVRTAAHARAAPEAAPDLDGELDAALAARGVSRGDVARVAPAAMLAFTDAVAARDVRAARAAARELVDASADASRSRDVLGRRLERLGDRLLDTAGVQDQAELRAVETAYFELRAAFPPAPGRAAADAFAARLSALEARHAALKRPDPPTRPSPTTR